MELMNIIIAISVWGARWMYWLRGRNFLKTMSQSKQKCRSTRGDKRWEKLDARHTFPPPTRKSGRIRLGPRQVEGQMCDRSTWLLLDLYLKTHINTQSVRNFSIQQLAKIKLLSSMCCQDSREQAVCSESVPLGDESWHWNITSVQAWE